MHDLNKIVVKETHAEVILYKGKQEQVEIARAIIDIESINEVGKYKWSLNSSGYAVNSGRSQYLHQFLLINIKQHSFWW